MRRCHRPAAGQLVLLFVAALGDPLPPQVVARGKAPAPRPTDRPTWRPRRPGRRERPPEGVMDRKVDRFVRRGALAVYAEAGPPLSRAGLMAGSC